MVHASNGQDQPAQLFAAVSALQKQQAELAGNQTQLDSKLTDLAETIRVARLFMSRAGGKHKPLNPSGQSNPSGQVNPSGQPPHPSSNPPPSH
jgi:prefoldin subunit 5